jgi:hypothetical protein
MLPGLPATLCFAVIPNGALYQMPGLPMLRIVILGIDPSGLPFSLCSNVIPRGLLTQSLSNKREAFAFGFSHSHQLTQASL